MGLVGALSAPRKLRTDGAGRLIRHAAAIVPVRTKGWASGGG
ncbi:LEA_2 domain-containing protein [Psidium guajava]|nr:LEA_2 domain-containing protein [Psidium guajava]